MLLEQVYGLTQSTSSALIHGLADQRLDPLIIRSTTHLLNGVTKIA